MSSGIDPSLIACIVVEALDRENVIGVSMPSTFSTVYSRTGAQKLPENLGICFVKFSVQEIVESYRRTLERPLMEIRRRFGVKRGGTILLQTRTSSPR